MLIKYLKINVLYNQPHLHSNFFATVLRHGLLLKASGSMSGLLVSLRDYLSREKFQLPCYCYPVHFF